MGGTSEAVCDIAGVGTVLPVPVPIRRERLAAVSAGERIDSGGSTCYCFRMSVPPALATFI